MYRGSTVADEQPVLPFIEVVWREIILHLSIEDQNNLASVCRPLYCMVRDIQEKNSIAFGTLREEENVDDEIHDLELFIKKLDTSAQTRLIRKCRIEGSFPAFHALLMNRAVCCQLEYLRLATFWFPDKPVSILIPLFSKLKTLEIMHQDSFEISEGFVTQFIRNCPALQQLAVYMPQYMGGNYLLVLPQSLTKLQCDLSYPSLLENLLAALSTGITLEELIITLPERNSNYFYAHGKFCELAKEICDSILDLGLYNCSGFLTDFIGIEYLHSLMLSSPDVIHIEEAKLFLSSCSSVVNLQVSDHNCPDSRNFDCMNYIHLISCLDELPNLTRLNLICKLNDFFLEVLADSVRSVQVITCKLEDNSENSLTLPAFLRLVSKLQKSLRVLSVEKIVNFDESELIATVEEALDTPRTFTIYLPTGDDNVTLMGRLTIVRETPRLNLSSKPHYLSSF